MKLVGVFIFIAFSLNTVCLLNACHLVMDSFSSFFFFFVGLYLQWVRQESPDVLCLQETKCAEKALPADITSMPEYPYKYWSGSEDKEGYSGVAMLCKTEPLDVTYGIGERRRHWNLIYASIWAGFWWLLLLEKKPTQKYPLLQNQTSIGVKRIWCVTASHELGSGLAPPLASIWFSSKDHLTKMAAFVSFFFFFLLWKG